MASNLTSQQEINALACREFSSSPRVLFGERDDPHRWMTFRKD